VILLLGIHKQVYRCWMWVHCKKMLAVFPSRESSVSDIPEGDGKAANLFLQCRRAKHAKERGVLVVSCMVWSGC
jgi:hypothetical protein